MLPKPALWQNAFEAHVQVYSLSPLIFTQDWEPQLTPHDPQLLWLLRATHWLLQQ